MIGFVILWVRGLQVNSLSPVPVSSIVVEVKKQQTLFDNSGESMDNIESTTQSNIGSSQIISDIHYLFYGKCR